MLDSVLLPSFDVEFLVESRPLARRLHEPGLALSIGDLRRTDTYVKADLSPSTCIIVEDTGRKTLKHVLEAIRDAGGTLIYVLGMGTSPGDRREDEIKAAFPDVSYLSMTEMFGPPFLTEVGRSLTRARVQQYQRYSAMPIAS